MTNEKRKIANNIFWKARLRTICKPGYRTEEKKSKKGKSVYLLNCSPLPQPVLLVR
jgi:hypothetical protein